MVDYLALEGLRWQESPRENQVKSELFLQYGIEHAFTGRGLQPPSKVRHIKQVHGCELIDAQQELENSIGDGLYTSEKNSCIAVKTADCIPLLLCDEHQRLALAVHAGWRGLTAGIIVQAIETAKKRGVDPSNLLAAVGPCISNKRFQVGREVVDALHSKHSGLTKSQAGLCTFRDGQKTWQIDLAAAAGLILLNAGLIPAKINIIAACTYELDSWHSARREKAGFGSNWAWICLRDAT